MIVDKFVELILDPTLQNLEYALLKSLAANCQAIIEDFMDVFQSIIQGDFRGLGADLAQIFYLATIH